LSEILIVGLGNPLMGDDGVGAAVVEELLRRDVPKGAQARIAPDILHLPSIWGGEPDVWLVDAVRQDCKPGTIHVLEHSRVFDLKGTHRSAHQLSLPDGLRWLIHTYPGLANARYRLWGVEPKDLSPNPRLSPEVAAAVAHVACTMAGEASRRLSVEE
jgi:hydrogenase maturation protease